MRSNDEYLVLITRYLDNPDDLTLKNDVDRARAESAENENYFLEIERAWNLSAQASALENFDSNFSVKKFNKKIKSVTAHRGISPWLRGIAASLLIAAFGIWFYSANYRTVYLVKTTGKDQIDSVKLADGSVVILAENSQLKYPEKFSSSERAIELFKGQAFFKITKNPEQPFKVMIAQSSVIVLGTKFNIKVSATHIDVGVINGRVMFSPYANGTESILTAGQALTYNIENKQLIGKTSQNSDAWLTKELIFVDTPLEEVCKQLTEYYHRDIQFTSEKKAVKKLNATFKYQTLDQVLEVLDETYNIKITKTKDKITLTTP